MSLRWQTIEEGKLNDVIKDAEQEEVELQGKIYEVDEEIKRLNNNWKELEKLIDSYKLGKYDYEIPVYVLEDKLKELKEGK